MHKTWLLALLLLACSDTDTRASRFVAKLHDCELLSEGKLNVWIEKEDECLLRCFTAASCRDVEAMVCSSEAELSDAYLSCIQHCGVQVGDDFECKDGSSDEAYHCDATEDCDDGSDEKDCPASAFFVCDDGERLPKDFACDGEDDCSEAEDEKRCESHPGFRCKSGRYVVGEGLECDGEDDCEDGSDELKCVERDLLFECGDGTAVAKHEVCNGNRDCEDGSDEAGGCAMFQCSD